MSTCVCLSPSWLSASFLPSLPPTPSPLVLLTPLLFRAGCVDATYPSSDSLPYNYSQQSGQITFLLVSIHSKLAFQESILRKHMWAVCA